MQQTVAVNEMGQRIGQDHPRAKLSDREVELMQQLRDEGLALRELARTFECSLGQVWNICSGTKRGQIPAGWKVIKRGEHG